MERISIYFGDGVYQKGTLLTTFPHDRVAICIDPKTDYLVFVYLDQFNTVEGMATVDKVAELLKTFPKMNI